MMDFPIGELMDERACYHWPLDLLHPGGLRCPRCGGAFAGRVGASTCFVRQF
jgi:hypothetical protein